MCVKIEAGCVLAVHRAVKGRATACNAIDKSSGLTGKKNGSDYADFPTLYEISAKAQWKVR